MFGVKGKEAKAFGEDVYNKLKWSILGSIDVLSLSNINRLRLETSKKVSS